MKLTLPMLQILLALWDEERHGYGILLEVEGRTGSRLGTGTLYTALQRLLAKELIEEAPRASEEDARRRYYRLTADGRQAAERDAGQLARVVGMAREKTILS